MLSDLTAFSKNVLNSLDMILSWSFNFIFDVVLIFSDKKGLIVFQNCLLSVIFLMSKELTNVLTNGLKISDQTNADFFQVNISQMYGKIG